MIIREFAMPDGSRIELELEEESGRVSWRLWIDGLDNGGDTFETRGRERFEDAARALLKAGYREL